MLLLGRFYNIYNVKLVPDIICNEMQNYCLTFKIKASVFIMAKRSTIYDSRCNIQRGNRTPCIHKEKRTDLGQYCQQGPTDTLSGFNVGFSKLLKYFWFHYFQLTINLFYLKISKLNCVPIQWQHECTYLQPIYSEHTVSVGPKLLTSHSNANRCVTCYFVSNQFTGLNFSDAPKQTLELLLGHVLRQVVDYQVSFTVLYAP